MDLSIAVGAGVVGVVVAVVAMGIGLWVIRTTMSIVRKLVMFSLVFAIGFGVVAATVLAALAARH